MLDRVFEEKEMQDLFLENLEQFIEKNKTESLKTMTEIWREKQE